MFAIFKWFFEIPRDSGDKSKHRLHALKYEDMCF